MLEPSGLSSATPVESPVGLPADAAVGRMPVSATVTDGSGKPILTVTVDVQPASTVEPLTVSADGDVDLDTAPLLRAALVAAVGRHPHVCCDLRGVTFFGAAGINALVAGRRRAIEIGSRLEVRGAEGMTRRVLELTGLEFLLSGHP
jgi:anti-anti-sigma factor